MLTTKNYKLKKPELTDSPPDITVMNFNWDTIDEKLFAVIQAWEKFKASGGTITGPLKANEILLNTSEKYGFKYDGATSLIMSVANAERYQFGHDGIHPLWTNDLSLGMQSRTWKDIWLGTFSKDTAGYTKLPNGMILQWGNGGFSVGQSSNTLTFPIAFPNKCVVVNCNLTGSSTVNPIDCMYSIGNVTQHYFDVHYNKPRNEYQGVSWIAIGY